MNTDARNNVYSTTGFLDIISSPVFYMILIVTLVLGLLSVFGFIQNPYKLKTFVNAIHQKVSVSERHSGSFSLIDYSLKQSNESVAYPERLEGITVSYIDTNRYSIFSKNQNLPLSPKNSLKQIAFDYDITSKQFWSDLELPVSNQDVDFKKPSLFMLDTPLNLEGSDSLYSMKVQSKRT